MYNIFTSRIVQSKLGRYDDKTLYSRNATTVQYCDFKYCTE